MSTLLAETTDAISVSDRSRKESSFLPSVVAFVAAFGRIVFGMTLCFLHLTSIVAVGWTFRLMRRRIYRGFWKASPLRDEIPFETFVSERPELDVPSRVVPRWFAVERISERIERPKSNGASPGALRRFFRIPAAMLGGLAINVKTGVVALACTYILTGPACLLWLGSWYDGWNNSFNKGYEQAFVGPMTGILGVVLFITAMLHVPLAWAHLAATGDARAFFAFGFVRKLARSRPLGTVLLALFISLATLPVSIARAAPSFFVNDNFPYFATAPFEEIVAFTQRFNLFTGGIAFLCFVLAHLAAGRHYRKSLLALLTREPSVANEFHPRLARVLGDLSLLPEGSARRRHPLVRVVFGTWRWTWNFVLGLALIFLWFTVAAQVYVVAFINFRPGVVWLNQPVLHMPSLHFEPTP